MKFSSPVWLVSQNYSNLQILNQGLSLTVVCMPTCRKPKTVIKLPRKIKVKNTTDHGLMMGEFLISPLQLIRWYLFMFTSDKTVKWIENLAEQECLIQLGERSSLDLCTTKDEVLSSETISFVRSLFYHFEYLTRLFNTRVELAILKIKIEKHGENYNSFSVCRNQVRLVVTGSRSGAVHLQCLREDNGAMGTMNSVLFSGLIEARFETFHEVKWYFLDSVILPEQVARHYLTEFLQISRSSQTH